MWPKGAGAPKKPRLAELRAEIKRRDATARPSYWSEPQCYQWLMAHAIPDEAATADAAAAAPAPAPAAAAAPAPAAAPGAAPVTEDEAAPAATREHRQGRACAWGVGAERSVVRSAGAQ